ncbi:MAG: DUF1592 domain-containing protein [Myxococcota bacterium]
MLALALVTGCYSGLTADGESDASDTSPDGADGEPDGGHDDGAEDGSDDAGDSGGSPSGECGALSMNMRRMTLAQYRRSVEVIFDGLVSPSSRFPAPSGETQSGFSTELGAREIGEHDVEQTLYAAEDVAEEVSVVLPQFLPCAEQSPPTQACAETFVDRFGRRAFRRTLTADEREILLSAFALAQEDGASFADSIALVVVQLLQAPQFVYLSEYDAPSERPLEPFEIASRLSYLLWDSAPDDALLDLAENGGLATADAVTAEAERMLNSPKADTTVARFFREWTRTRRLTQADKSPDVFPSFNADVAASLGESFDRFVVDAVREGQSLEGLVEGAEVWVDANTAPLFGVEAPAEGQWAKVAVDPERHRGILTQPALLASLSHSDRTSHVFRGYFVRSRLLCHELPPPPAAATSVEFDLPPNPTARDISEARMANDECAACHASLDPPGLAFEQFDALGRFSPTDALGREIDPSGVLTGLGEDIVFADHAEMIDALAAEPAMRRCFARQLFRFALSRMETPDDACVVEAIEAVLEETDGDLSAGLLAIVGVDSFRHRETL